MKVQFQGLKYKLVNPEVFSIKLRFLRSKKHMLNLFISY